MVLTFQDFEQFVDPTILQRGQEYYRGGHVEELDEMDEGQWQAIVVGTEDYEVTVEQSPDGALNLDCTCPYDLGPYCKHQVAVLYAIREQFPDAAGVKGKKAKSSKPRKPAKQTQADKFREVIQGLPRETLEQLMVERLKKDKLWASEFMLQYSPEADDPKSYGETIRAVLKVAKGREGYIDYWESRRVGAQLTKLLNRAEQLATEGQAGRALPLIQAMVENLVPAMQYADDSDGSIGGAIEEAFNLLEEQIIPALNENEKRKLLNYCLTEAHDPKYQGWDWGWDWLWVAASLVNTAQEREQLNQALDEMLERGKTYRQRAYVGGFGMGRMDDTDSFYREFDAERVANVKLEVIKRLDPPERVHQFIVEHVHLSNFRKHLVEYTIERKEYAEAKRLCEEAITQYGKSAPGLVTAYRQYLFMIALAQDKPEEVIRRARELFLTTYDFQYYELLKKTVPDAEWPAFVERLLKDTDKPGSGWYGLARLDAEIYAREGMWERLLALVKGDAGYLLEHYRRELEPRFPDDFCAVYEKAVYKMLQQASGRDTYQRAAEYLRRMKTLGKGERAQAMAAELKATYPNRRAMIEELGRV